MGSVHLSVTDGERALAFYRDVLGLIPFSADPDEIRLGAGGKELVVLHPGAERPVVEGRTVCGVVSLRDLFATRIRRPQPR